MKKINEAHLEFHSVANIFPMMTEAEFSSLKQDVTVNGLREPIWLYDGKIIDGRNRYRACLETKTKPLFRKYEGTESALIDFVISLNLHRRHLTTSQRACLAVALMPELEQAAKESLSRKMSAIKKGKVHTETKSDSWQKAAEVFNVSLGYISTARKIQTISQSIFEEVKAGKLTLQQAKVQLQSVEDSSKLKKGKTDKEPLPLVLSRREEIRVKEIIVELGVSEAKAKEYILKRRRIKSVTQKDKTTMKEIKFRVYEEDKSELQKKAKEQGKTVAELIRDLLKLKFHR